MKFMLVSYISYEIKAFFHKCHEIKACFINFLLETGSRLKVSSDRLVKPEIEPATPGLQGKRFIHYTTAATMLIINCANRGHFGWK